MTHFCISSLFSDIKKDESTVLSCQTHIPLMSRTLGDVRNVASATWADDLPRVGGFLPPSHTYSLICFLCLAVRMCVRFTSECIPNTVRCVGERPALDNCVSLECTVHILFNIAIYVEGNCRSWHQWESVQPFYVNSNLPGSKSQFDPGKMANVHFYVSDLLLCYV